FALRLARRATRVRRQIARPRARAVRLEADRALAVDELEPLERQLLRHVRSVRGERERGRETRVVERGPARTRRRIDEDELTPRARVVPVPETVARQPGRADLVARDERARVAANETRRAFVARAYVLRAGF